MFSGDLDPSGRRQMEAFAGDYLEDLSEKLAALDLGGIAQVVETFLEAHHRSASIFLFGNGGSAATASHWANDLMAVPGAHFRAISLADNNALLTALANDHGFEEVFAHQLEKLIGPGDVAVGISASGNSPNVLRAVEMASCKDALTVGVTGFGGGKLRKLVNVALHVPSAVGEYGPVEDIHLVVNHLITAYLRGVFTGSSGRGALSDRSR